MNEYKVIKISKGDEYKVDFRALTNFISNLDIGFFKNFDIEIKKFSEDEWIIKILKENNNDWEEVKFNE